MCAKCPMCLKWPICHKCSKCPMCPKCPNSPMCPNWSCVPNVPCVLYVPNVTCAKKKQSPRQIMMENITAMANINHMGGQSHLLTLITKSIDTTFVSYQPLCCGGRDTPVFVNKNGDPFSYYIFDFLITGIDLVFKCRNPRTERAKYLYSEI